MTGPDEMMGPEWSRELWTEWWTSGWGSSPCEEWEMVLATNAGATAGVDTATGLDTRGAAAGLTGTAWTGLTGNATGLATEATGLAGSGDTSGLDTDTGAGDTADTEGRDDRFGNDGVSKSFLTGPDSL